MIEAVVLAGGLGRRLRSVIADRPKPMALVGGRPFLEILLRSLADKGVSRVILSLGYKASMISDHFGSSFAGLEIAHCVEDEPLGTGGAIRLALQCCRNERCYVLNGDTYVDLDIAEIEKYWNAHRNPILVGRYVEDTSRFGRLTTEGAQVTGFAEKGPSGPGLISAGCYLFRRDQLDDYASGTAFSIETDYLQSAVQRERFDLFVVEGDFIDIGVPEELQRAQSLLADDRAIGQTE